MNARRLRAVGFLAFLSALTAIGAYLAISSAKAIYKYEEASLSALPLDKGAVLHTEQLPTGHQWSLFEGAIPIELGDLMSAVRYMIPVTFVNGTTQPTVIAGFRSDCGCAAVDTTLPLMLSPGSRVSGLIRLDTASNLGRLERRMEAFSDLGEIVGEIKIGGTVWPSLSVKPGCLIGQADETQPFPQPLSLTLINGKHLISDLQFHVPAKLVEKINVRAPRTLMPNAAGEAIIDLTRVEKGSGSFSLTLADGGKPLTAVSILITSASASNEQVFDKKR